MIQGNAPFFSCFISFELALGSFHSYTSIDYINTNNMNHTKYIHIV